MDEAKILRIDLDKPLDEWGWLQDYQKAVKAVLAEFGYKAERIIVRKSPSGKGLHVWIHLNHPIPSDMEKLKLQAFCYDDMGRVFINRLRVLYRHLSNWNKLFSEAKAVANLDPKCEKCRMRATLLKIEEETKCPTLPE
jgi:hypothetical protein